MSVISAPSGAGRSPYTSEPSIEVLEATSRLGRIKTDTQPALAIRALRAPITTAKHWRTAMCIHSPLQRRVREVLPRDRRIHHSQAGDRDGGYGYLPKSPCQPHGCLGLHRRKRLEIETMRRRL